MKRGESKQESIFITFSTVHGLIIFKAGANVNIDLS